MQRLYGKCKIKLQTCLTATGVFAPRKQLILIQKKLNSLFEMNLAFLFRRFFNYLTVSYHLPHLNKF